jgi:hypothetical protein
MKINQPTNRTTIESVLSGVMFSHQIDTENVDSLCSALRSINRYADAGFAQDRKLDIVRVVNQAIRKNDGWRVYFP